MSNYRTKIPAFVLIVFASLSADNGTAQSGGGFEITEAVIAGGGAISSNGIFEIETTTGQPASGGPMGSGPFGITSGFWNFTSLAPTAAGVSISGRVLNPVGNGVLNTTVLLHTQDGELRTARSSSYGYYRFDQIPAGKSVFISVESKLYTYQPRVVLPLDDLTEVDFVPDP